MYIQLAVVHLLIQLHTNIYKKNG